ncbi:response regulator transcription factor [Mesorhizobium sp. RMAD-H1]|uniref:response regulator n=1 Tax=Mesorhizobium sp. RMAD-H1 TaxID=2587065 RepID=UPI001607280B|nr:response regulator transcription factor [Mesorhizobium sp. RMAD-H1]MBB2973044.1 two-component system nitrate/nitrite response regulator NarL [Mesorhizobium sp. RMAD-H1]
MMSGIRIAVIDDHPLFREGVARSLAEVGFEIVAEGSTREDAIRISQEQRPDILLMDISMPGGGLQAILPILQCVPDQKIIMLTVSEAVNDIVRALKSGAKGYVLKGVGSRALAEIVRAVASGETYVSPSLSARLFSDLTASSGAPTDADPLAKLTAREREILDLVAAGLSNKHIAIELDLHEKTIKHHLTRIFAKLGVKNRTEAAMTLARRQQPEISVNKRA